MKCFSLPDCYKVDSAQEALCKPAAVTHSVVLFPNTQQMQRLEDRAYPSASGGY